MESSLPRHLMSDEEWSLFEHFILAIRAPNGRKPANHRPVLDGIFWIARTGSPWRDLPEELVNGPASTGNSGVGLWQDFGRTFWKL